MNYIFDTEDCKGILGSEATVTYFINMARAYRLPYLLSMLTVGGSIHLGEVIKELSSIEWPKGDQGIQEAVDNVVKVLSVCKGVAFVTDGTDVFTPESQIP